MPKKLTKEDLDSFRQLLQRMRAKITGDISILQEEALGANGNLARSASEAEEGVGYYQEFSLELLQRDENTLGEIDDALTRMQEGSFGQCESCEVPIPKPRLRAVPYARNCIDCQRELEQSG